MMLCPKSYSSIQCIDIIFALEPNHMFETVCLRRADRTEGF